MLFFVVICVVIIFVMLANVSQDRPVAKPVAHNYYTGYGVQKTGVDYDNLPYTDALMVRFCRVENKELICVDINRMNKTALFRSRSCPNECYHTTLDKCTCPDSEVPCKHMLYLANSLGCLENWKRGLPQERYNNVVKTYNNCQYRNDPEGWVRDNTGTNNWHPGRTRIGSCW